MTLAPHRAEFRWLPQRVKNQSLILSQALIQDRLESYPGDTHLPDLCCLACNDCLCEGDEVVCMQCSSASMLHVECALSKYFDEDYKYCLYCDAYMQPNHVE